MLGRDRGGISGRVNCRGRSPRRTPASFWLTGAAIEPSNSDAGLVGWDRLWIIVKP